MLNYKYHINFKCRIEGEFYIDETATLAWKHCPVPQPSSFISIAMTSELPINKLKSSMTENKYAYTYSAIGNDNCTWSTTE